MKERNQTHVMFLLFIDQIDLRKHTCSTLDSLMTCTSSQYEITMFYIDCEWTINEPTLIVFFNFDFFLCDSSQFSIIDLCNSRLFPTQSVSLTMAPKTKSLRTPQKSKMKKVIKDICCKSALSEAKSSFQKSDRITPIKQKKVRNLDQEVQKVITDNFRKFTSKQTDQLIVKKDPEDDNSERLTLRQRLYADKHMLAINDPRAPTMGKRYYSMLRDAYQDWTSPSKRLKPDDLHQIIDETLQTACLAITASPVDVTLMNDFFASSSLHLNQIETVILHQHMFRLDVRQEAHVGCIMNAMRFFSRTKLHERMTKEWDIMKEFYDLALCASWHSSKQAGGLTEDMWIKGLWCQISMIYSPEQFLEIIAHPAGASWEPLEHKITTQIGHGKLAIKLVGASFRALMSEKLMSKMKKLIELEVETDHITEECVLTIRASFMALCKESAIDPHHQHGPRSIKVSYRGMDYDHTTTSYKQSFERLWYCSVVSKGVDAGIIPPLWCETELIKGRPVSTVTIAPSLIKDAITARNQGMAMTGDEIVTSELLRLIIDKRQLQMTTIDEHWPIIADFWDSIITQGQNSRFNGSVIECLPSADNDISPDESVRQLLKFKNSKIMNLAGLGLQCQVQTIVDAVPQIKNRRSPDIATDGSLLMKRIGLVLCWWCHYTNDQGEVIKGKKAVLGIYGKIDQAIKDGGMEHIKSVDLEPLIMFRYVLGVDQQVNVMKWAEDLMAIRGSFARSALQIAEVDQSARTIQEDISERNRRLMSVFD